MDAENVELSGNPSCVVKMLARNVFSLCRPTVFNKDAVMIQGCLERTSRRAYWPNTVFGKD